MPPDIEVYPLRVWQKVIHPWQLHQDDRVRITGTHVPWSVRVTDDGNGRKLRLRAIDEDDDSVIVGRNVFYHDSVVFLAEEGLLEKLLLADVREYDVWANERFAFSYRGSSGQWVDLCNSALPLGRTEELPDDLALVWRRSITETSF